MEVKTLVVSAHRVLIGATILLAFASRISAASLLSNAGFESDPGGGNQNLPGWQIYGANAYNETSAAIARSGTNYFKVYQSFNGQVNYSGNYQDYVSSPGANYSADGWAYTGDREALAARSAAWVELF